MPDVSTTLLALEIIGKIEYTPEEALLTLERLEEGARGESDKAVLTAFENAYEKVTRYL